MLNRLRQIKAAKDFIGILCNGCKLKLATRMQRVGKDKLIQDAMDRKLNKYLCGKCRAAMLEKTKKNEKVMRETLNKNVAYESD